MGSAHVSHDPLTSAFGRFHWLAGCHLKVDLLCPGLCLVWRFTRILFFWVLQEISSVEVEKASAMPAGVGKWKDLQ